MGRVDKRTAIVTGGGRGIGKAIAMLLAREGASVVLTQRNVEQGAEVAGEITSGGDKAMYVTQDVTREEDWKRVLALAMEQFGPPDILVNNAGIYRIKPLAETSLEEWRKVMAVNVEGVFLGMKHCAPHMAEHRGGSIVNISSAAGKLGLADHACYGAGKAAVCLMTRNAAVEYARKNVRINAVLPGMIDTGMIDYAAEVYETTKDQLGKSHPVGHMGEPMDVAQAVLYLASEEAKFVTGAELCVDGGLTAT